MSDLYPAIIALIVAVGLYILANSRTPPGGWQLFFLGVAIVLLAFALVAGLQWLSYWLLDVADEVFALREDLALNVPEVEIMRMKVEIAKSIRDVSAERFEFIQREVELAGVDVIPGEPVMKFLHLPGIGRVPHYIVDEWIQLSRNPERIQRGEIAPVGEWTDSKARDFVIMIRDYLRRNRMVTPASGPYSDRWTSGWNVDRVAQMFDVGV